MSNLVKFWHGRLDHINFETIRRLMNLDLIPKSKIAQGSKCPICGQAKLPKKPFQHIKRYSHLLDLIRSDICDCCRTPTRVENMYFISFIDDHSRFSYTYLIKSNNEVLRKFMIFKANDENQLEKTIKVLIYDKGGEYTSNAMFSFCEEHCA